MKKIALVLPGNNYIQPPAGVPNAGINTGQNLINLGFTLVFVLAVVLAIAFIIYSGIQWTISGGDKQKIQQARQRLVFSIVGLVVIVGAFAIVKIIISLLGGNPSFFLNTP